LKVVLIACDRKSKTFDYEDVCVKTQATFFESKVAHAVMHKGGEMDV
jgi:hypothetical protein